jgi:hypothetical protein
MRPLLLLQLLAVAAVASLSSAEHCFTKPTDPLCVDGSLRYSDSSLRADAEMACASVPWASGCSLWRKCSTGLASGKYCEPWHLMAAVCLDTALAGVEGCRRYRLLCPASRETVVSQCSDASGVPNFLHTAGAIAAMQKLCTEMPNMKWCSECPSSNDPATNCRDPLSSIASICLDHYMSDCAPWYEMCKQLPKGLEVICGASGERAVDGIVYVCVCVCVCVGAGGGGKYCLLVLPGAQSSDICAPGSTNKQYLCSWEHKFCLVVLPGA